MRDAKIPELRTDEQAYIAEHYGNATVQDMATHLKRGAATIYAYMKEKKLKPFKAERTTGYDHPFRKRNRQLEKNLLLIRIENGKNNK